MKVFYSPYALTPKKRANRLSDLAPKPGVYLRGTLGDKVLFADYFPHHALGDRGPEEFLGSFKFQEHAYDRKVFALLLKDADLRRSPLRAFRNHQLWSAGETPAGPVVKYKLGDPEDFAFLPLLAAGLRLRLDANGCFDRVTFRTFVDRISAAYRSLIDYVEDPAPGEDWSGFPLPTARDFIAGTPHAYVIYKPNREERPQTDAKIVVSSYLGSDLGRWHAYGELLAHGDLAETHGIVTESFYDEELPLFRGSYRETFTPDRDVARRIYRDLAARDWKLLCSM
jgi:hypothetical protein